MAKGDTEKMLRARFREACAERDAIRAQAKPYRDERDALQADADRITAKQKALADQFKVIEAPLLDLDKEIATISRALGGKTAEPDQE